MVVPTPAGRVVLLLSGLVVLVAPFLAAAQIARAIPVDWLTWVPFALAAALSWLVLVR
jgi:hypothetical protein